MVEERIADFKAKSRFNPSALAEDPERSPDPAGKQHPKALRSSSQESRIPIRRGSSTLSASGVQGICVCLRRDHCWSR